MSRSLLGGLVVIECQSRSGDMINLLADILTNQVISELPAGDIYVSPNTRYIVFTEHPNNMTVHRVTDEGQLSSHSHSIMTREMKGGGDSDQIKPFWSRTLVLSFIAFM